MHIYVIRHGQKCPHAVDPELTPIGVAQATQTAAALESIEIDFLISSPLTRAYQTAKIISERLGLQTQVDSRLLERVNREPTVPTRQLVNQWSKSSQNQISNNDLRNSLLSTGSGIATVLNEIEQDNATSKVLLVSHAGVISDFLRSIFSDRFLLQNDFHTHNYLYDASVPECSITHLIKNNSQYQVVKLLSSDHL